MILAHPKQRDAVFLRMIVYRGAIQCGPMYQVMKLVKRFVYTESPREVKRTYVLTRILTTQIIKKLYHSC